ncbi:hypothetical protein [Gulosibacter faecalis]|uniref:PKD domain-containing protein n=1 Tax=Gulosibacter faecalis TaxID=272240 RepID=A0ABW5UU88_9MICO|nr:hypothetical protein [Gulosibacter faecalis]
MTWQMNCSNGGDSVDISIDSSGGGGSGGSGGGGGADWTGGTGYAPPSACAGGSSDSRCMGELIFGDADPADPGPAPLPATLNASDLANVAPTQAELFMEPDGWAILGQPVNFWTSASTHTVDTTVLGHSVTVTFTPVSTTYDYGDGTSQTLETPGASWADQGLPELSDTHTSHRYSVDAPVTVSAIINYSATVAAAGRTITVTGTIQSISTTLSFDLYESDTYLAAQP